MMLRIASLIFTVLASAKAASLNSQPCGGVFSGPIGKISSPGYPHNTYPPSANCTYVIEVPENNVIAYESVHMDIEDPDTISGICVYDVLKIFDGEQLASSVCGIDPIYLTATTTNKMRLVFTSDISHEAGGFELKWHQIDLNNRPVAYECNFDGALPLCSGWRNENKDYEWYFKRGYTPSANTGPLSDHTTLTNEGRYAYIEASKVEENSTAILTLPTAVSDELNEHRCLTYWYHMFGAGTGTLKIMQVDKDEEDTEISTVVIDQIEGDQGDTWFKGQHTIALTSVFTSIQIHGIRGDAYTSDIAIDDISLKAGFCIPPNESPDVDVIVLEDSETTTASTTTSATPTTTYILNTTTSTVSPATTSTTTTSTLTTPIPHGESTTVSIACRPNLEFALCETECNITCSSYEKNSKCSRFCIQDCTCPETAPVLLEGSCVPYESCPRTKDENHTVKLKKTHNFLYNTILKILRKAMASQTES